MFGNHQGSGWHDTMSVETNGSAWPSRLGEFLENLPVALCRTTPKGQFVYGNVAFKRLLGYRVDIDLRDHNVRQWYLQPAVRREIIEQVRSWGHVTDFSLELLTAGRKIIPCKLAVRGIFDTHGVLIGLDEVWHQQDRSPDRTSEGQNCRHGPVELILTLDLEGCVLGLKGKALAGMDLDPDTLRGRPITELVRMETPDLLDLFLAGIQENEREQGIISIVDKAGRQQQIHFAARLIKFKGAPDRIECIARIPINPARAGDLNQAKFDGVREMAGGVAHRLNQPLMVLNNRLGEIISESDPHSRLHAKLIKVRETINEINEISYKLGGINKYAPMDYVGGIRIIDIDQSSTTDTV